MTALLVTMYLVIGALAAGLLWFIFKMARKEVTTTANNCGVLLGPKQDEFREVG